MASTGPSKTIQMFSPVVERKWKRISGLRQNRSGSKMFFSGMGAGHSEGVVLYRKYHKEDRK